MPLFSPYKSTSLKNSWSSLRAIDIDGRELENGVIPQNFADVLQENTLTTRFLYVTGYRINIAGGIPDFLLQLRFTYYLQPDWTGATVFPDAPPNSGDVDHIYFYHRINTATSLGTTGISDIPTTWRNYTGLLRINLERNELSEAQQLGIIDGIEREISAGMGQSETSTSTTSRIIDFANTSAGANAAISKAELQARGWDDVSATESEKFFPDINGDLRRWRLQHNS